MPFESTVAEDAESFIAWLDAGCAPSVARHALSLLSACLNDRERVLAALRPKDIERACMRDVRLDGFLPRILLGHGTACLTSPCAKILESRIEGEGGAGAESGRARGHRSGGYGLLWAAKDRTDGGKEPYRPSVV